MVSICVPRDPSPCLPLAMSVSRVVSGLVSVLLWIGIFCNHDFTHFTWWSLAAWATYAACATFAVDHYFFYLFVAIESGIIVAVVAMSALRCSLLQTTLDKVGSVRYFFGNFLMHYAPLLFAIAVTDASRARYPVANIFSGYGLFVMYNTYFIATDVYGCSVNHAYVVGGAAIVLGCFLLAYTGVAHTRRANA
jgi:hypothetical protein